jgi:hypothetical protein
VDSIRSVLRRAIASGETSLEPILESLHSLESIVPIENSEYLNSLQQKVDNLQIGLNTSEKAIAEFTAEKAIMFDQIDQTLSNSKKTEEEEKKSYRNKKLRISQRN